MAKSKYMKVIMASSTELSAMKVANKVIPENVIISTPTATLDSDKFIIGNGTNINTPVQVTDVSADLHSIDTSNPHSVTKTQVGLSNVDNTSDVNKPVSTSVQTLINEKAPIASPIFTGDVGIGDTPNSNAVFDVSSVTKGVLLPRMTKAQRILLTAIEGMEVYQTDNGPGKYVYTNGIWCQISGLEYAVIRNTVNQTSVSDNTIITWSNIDGNMVLSSNSVTLKANKTYMIEHDESLTMSNTSDATFVLCDGVGTTLSNQSSSRMVAVTNSNNYAISSPGQMIFTPTVDTVVKVKCSVIVSGTCTVRSDGTYWKIVQIS